MPNSPEITNIVEQNYYKVRSSTTPSHDAEAFEGVSEHNPHTESFYTTFRPDVYAIEPHKKIRGTIIYQGTEVEVTSDRFRVGGTIYIGGEVQELTLAEIDNPDWKGYFDRLRNDGVDMVVRTESGLWKPLREGDRVLERPETTKQRPTFAQI